jgi:hypothetical protein
MTFKLYLNAKIISNSKFSIIYLFCITKKQRAHLKASFWRIYLKKLNRYTTEKLSCYVGQSTIPLLHIYN